MVRDETIAIEQLADAGWPAEEVAPLGAWRLRFTGGVTYRANSVLTTAAGAGPNVAGAVEAAEAFYGGRGQPTVFHLTHASAPAGLDEMLEDRGYRREKPSEVWTAATGDVVRLAGGGAAGDAMLAAEPGAMWIDLAFEGTAAQRALYAGMVRRIAAPRAFASLRVAGELAACGLAVAAGEWAGLFCIATLPPYRRQRLGTAVVGRLAAWAAGRGTARMYLQVMGSNEPAQAMYGRLGFTLHHPYHYRVRWAGHGEVGG